MKKRTFGPAVEHTPDGLFRPLCTWCAFRVGETCTHVSPERRLTELPDTPDWCEMREDMILDAKEMAAKSA